MVTSTARESRSQLITRLDETLRKVGAQSVLVSDLVATRVGFNSTDLECLDLLYLAGVTTAGTLAKHTGLTTGATTAVIDRLERAGFVRRSRDAHDRRRVLVEVLPSSAGRIQPLYAPLASRLEQLNKQYGERELVVVADYMARTLDILAEHVAWLQKQPIPSRRAPTRRNGDAGRRPRPRGIAAGARRAAEHSQPPAR